MDRLSMSLIVVFVLFTMLFIISTPVTAQLYVYKDDEVWFLPSGRMPDGEGIFFNPNVAEYCYNEESKQCIKAGFSASDATEGWVGVYWLAKGSFRGPGINVYEELEVKEETPIKLTFWARGEDGGERVNFKVGGVDVGDDSIVFPKETGWITLQKEWKQYEITLLGEDLSNVVGGFCWVTNEDQNPEKQIIWFYLDEIKFEFCADP